MGGSEEVSGAALEGRGDSLPIRPQPDGAQPSPPSSAIDIEDVSLIPTRVGYGPKSVEPSGYRPQRHKTFGSFFVFALGGFFNFFLLTIVHDLVPRTPLPDLVFMLLPQQNWAIKAGDILAGGVSLVTFAMVPLHACRWLVYRRLFLLAGFMYALRACVLAVTFLPPSFENPSEKCLPQATSVDSWEVLGRFRDYVLTLGLTSSQGKVLCGDLMFSGHTIAFTMALFFNLRYTPRRAWWLRWSMAAICYFGMCCMVISGVHYTMDVLVAYWLGSHLFTAYHAVFEAPEWQRHHHPVAWLWWYYVAAWFESGTGMEGRLRNGLEWPLPWPKVAVRAVARASRRLNDPPTPSEGLPTRSPTRSSESSPGASPIS